MPINVALTTLHQDRMIAELEKAIEDLGASGSEAVLDLTAVDRISERGLEMMEKLAAAAATKNVRVVLHGVNIHIYKVLRLMKMTSRFAFVD